ncbi:hypothetical protein FRB90_010739 [Tulasnella sp. 427]|nr:hypothetical protein FRB90_010739 [Tulasnella sp. 427]
MIKNLLEEKRQKSKARKWQAYPKYWNGTIITGRLTDAEQATQDPGRFSTSKPPGQPAPFIPPEIVRDIILYATDTFPAPASLHYPSPSASQTQNPASQSSPASSPFPYASCDFEDDSETDRKLHAISMRVKVAVSHVSKMWRDLATEFLFNSIRIHNSKQIPLLWLAFESDAKRRGEEVKKGCAAQPGTAPWWVREVWVDLDKFQHIVSEGTLPLFDLMDFLKMCPNIIVYRGFGRWREFQFQGLLKYGAVLKQILDLPVVERDTKAQVAEETELVVPDTRRRIELDLIDDCEPFFPLFSDRQRSVSTPLTITIPSITVMELRGLLIPRFTHSLEAVTVQLPNLTHLSILGADALKYATSKLTLPSLRSLTYATRRQPDADDEPHLERFLEKHGLTLEELTVLDRPCSKNFRRLHQLCPILETLRAHYVELPTSTTAASRSVRTVGLYGLEHVVHETRPNATFGEGLIHGVLNAFPEVGTVQDMSWRSGVIRQRAFTNWRDPEGERYREFWDKLLCAVKKGSSESAGLVANRKVTFLDWRGREVVTVPTGAPADRSVTPNPDDRLMDALVSRMRL